MNGPLSDTQRSSGNDFPTAAALLACGIALAVLVGLAPADDGTEATPVPLFAWRDVALVCFVAAVPLAGVVVAWLRYLLPGRVLPAAGLFLLGGVALVILRGPSSGGAVLRGLVSFGAAFSGLLILSPIVSPRTATCAAARRGAALFVAAAGLVVVPQVYIAARCRRDVERMQQYLDESRLGDAHRLAARVLILEPSAMLAQEPLRVVDARIGDVVRQLEHELATPPALDATPDELVARAERLAALGREEEALAVLDRLPRPRSPATGNLRGTILETLEDWNEGIRAYAAARSAAGDGASSPEQRGELLRSILGLAYCRRKLGSLPEAERLYLDALEMSPTAETHYLLAQFYEDTQRADRARTHARQAMVLDPQHFDARGRRLIDKLVTVHFGCWSAYREESGR